MKFTLLAANTGGKTEELCRPNFVNKPTGFHSYIVPVSIFNFQLRPSRGTPEFVLSNYLSVFLPLSDLIGMIHAIRL